MYFGDKVRVGAQPTDVPAVTAEEYVSKERERCANGRILPKERGGKMRTSKKGAVAEINGKKRKCNKILCARPFAQMRGHSAFFTFTTASNAL